MPFTIVRQDITRIKADVIVNAANTDLLMGGGVCGAIFKEAGADKLQKACDKVAPIKTGSAAITPGFNLQSKYVIHAAGPIYKHHSKEQNRQLLSSAYTSSLQLAVKNGCTSIAFPLISSGTYGYPKDEALKVATEAIRTFLLDNEIDVYLAMFDKASFEISKDLLGDVESYIDENYVNEHSTTSRMLLSSERYIGAKPGFVGVDATTDFELSSHSSIDDIIADLDEPFNQTLMRIIDAKGKSDAEVYKKANIDRKLFSKIRTGKGYMPGKRTIIALAIALELTLEETDDLLLKAGYALSHSQKFDVIVEYFIVSGKYDIFEINEVLFKYDQPLLGAC